MASEHPGVLIRRPDDTPHVAELVLDRPEALNAISTAQAQSITAATAELAADRTIRAVVLSSSVEKAFSVGADLKERNRLSDDELRQQRLITRAAYTSVLELPMPAIAAVHGYALGGGLELALGCDFRYLAEDALVGQPEILLGLIPGAGGTQRLPRVVGYQRAKDMVLTGRQVDAAEARSIGLADKVAPSDDVLALAMDDAGEWATKATAAIAAAKRALNKGAALPVSEGVLVEREQFQTAFGTRDAREGVDAFVEKRAAEFDGS